MDDIERRSKFETWLRGTSGYKACAKRGKIMSFRANFDGSYADYRVNDRWLAWKAALATATPSERFALVPVEPTEAMIEAFNRKDSLPYPEPNRVAYKAKHCYSAMLSARPEVK